jgi:hypothetical protein
VVDGSVGEQPYKEVDTAVDASIPCVRAAAVPGGQTQTKLLLANGAFELWARRSNRNGLVRDVTIKKNPPDAWADVAYQTYPTAFPEAFPHAGANPAEPRFWDLCLYNPVDLERIDTSYLASEAEVGLDHLLHKLGSLTRCDPSSPRVQGISLTQHAPGRGRTSSAAARIEFVKSNDIAALVSENGAVASIAPNILHVARVWVRCVKGSATVALVVSSLPETGREDGNARMSMTHYDAMSNISVGSDGPKNVLHCRLDPSMYAIDRDAESRWSQLEVGVMSSKVKHEVSVQLVMRSHSADAAILVDDASLEAVANAGPRASTASDGSSTLPLMSSNHCSGGGGGGVSYSDSHQCSKDPSQLFYRIREKGGVPVAFEQIHAMVTLGYKSIKCRRPTMDPTTTVECSHLSQATLPHLSAPDVKMYLDTLSNSELASHMGWSDLDARGPGVDPNASIAVNMLREGLPEAIERGVVRVLDGAEYNTPLRMSDNPFTGSAPTLGIMWHSMASTTSFKSYDGTNEIWKVRLPPHPGSHGPDVARVRFLPHIDRCQKHTLFQPCMIGMIVLRSTQSALFPFADDGLPGCVYYSSCEVCLMSLFSGLR